MEVAKTFVFILFVLIENEDSEDDIPLSKLTNKTQGKRKIDFSEDKKDSEEDKSGKMSLDNVIIK